MIATPRLPILCLLSFAMLLVSLDQYIVVVALPEIARDLGYSAQNLQSVVSAYAIASSGFLLLGGRASDVLGRRRVLVVGLALYCVASLLGGIATSVPHQLAARALQGLGGALVFPSTIAIINVTFEEGAERNRALGVWAGAGAAGLVIGVLLGGALTTFFSWRAVFLVNVPLAGAAVFAALWLIGPDGRVDQTRKFDVPGAVSVTAAISLIVVALVEGPRFGWLSPWTIAFLSAGIVSAIVFIFIERRTADPLLPVRMFENEWLRLASVVATLFMATFGALLYFLTILFQEVLGYDALQTGWAFLVPTVCVVTASSLAGHAVTVMGLKRTMIAALLVGLGGALSIAFVTDVDVSYVHLLPGLVAISIGDGALFTAMFAAGGTGIQSERQGVASAIVSTGSGIGAAVGLAVLVLISNASAVDFAGAHAKAAIAEGIANAAFAIAAGIVLTLAIVVFTNVTSAKSGER